VNVNMWYNNMTIELFFRDIIISVLLYIHLRLSNLTFILVIILCWYIFFILNGSMIYSY